MVKLVFCLRRKEGMTPEEFRRYWLETHGPLVRSHAATLGIRRYVQVHALDHPVGDALRASRGVTDHYDGVAELWFDDADAVMKVASTAEGQAAARALYEDELRFLDLDRCAAFFAVEHVVVES